MYTQSFNAKQLSHYHVAGPNYLVTFVESADELRTLAAPLTLLGAGTNRLWISPQHSTLVSFKPLQQIDFLSKNLVYIQAGVTLPSLIVASKTKGLGGLEFTWPIPATVGGALSQNFGAYGSQMGDLVHTITLYQPATGEFIRVQAKDKSDWFGYRESQIKAQGLMLVDATLQLAPMKTKDIQSKLESIQHERTSRYPIRHTCGSVFKNPPHMSAGQLLDECGLKGFRLGAVQTADTHANIIVADPEATTQDVLTLITFLKETVQKKTGIELEIEIEVY